MALTDKDMAFDLIKVLEESFTRCSAYEQLLEEMNSEDWNRRYKKLKQEHSEKVKKMFAHLREAILEAPDWSEAVRELLKGLEQTDQGDSENR